MRKSLVLLGFASFVVFGVLTIIESDFFIADIVLDRVPPTQPVWSALLTVVFGILALVGLGVLVIATAMTERA